MFRAVTIHGPTFIPSMPRKVFPTQSRTKTLRVDSTFFCHALCRNLLCHFPLLFYPARLCQKGAELSNIFLPKLQEGFTQSDLAQALRVSPRKVRRWVRVGWLNVHEGRVKERSLQGFLREHSDEIDSERLEPDLQAWLQGLGLKEGARHSRQWSGQRQHAVRVFVCGGCGRKVCGNAFYRHLRACRKVTHASN